MHCANVVVVVLLYCFLLRFITFIAISLASITTFGAAPAARTARSPAARRYVHKKCECAAQSRREKTGKALGVAVSLRAKARCVIVYTQNRYQIQGLRFALVLIRAQSGISPALISLRFRFHFRFGFLVGASSDCDCAPVRRRRRLFNPAPQSPVRQSYPRKWPKE